MFLKQFRAKHGANYNNQHDLMKDAAQEWKLLSKAEQAAFGSKMEVAVTKKMIKESAGTAK